MPTPDYIVQAIWTDANEKQVLLTVRPDGGIACYRDGSEDEVTLTDEQKYNLWNTWRTYLETLAPSIGFAIDIVDAIWESYKPDETTAPTTCGECGALSTQPHRPGCSYRYAAEPTRDQQLALMKMDLARDPRLEMRLNFLDRYGALVLLHEKWAEVGLQ